jgi:glucose/mannose-6-phosphate isomerase
MFVLRDVYLSWPEIIKSALEEWGRYSVDGVFNEVVVLGMGGSGIIGDYLQVLAAERGPIPVYVVKSHIFPRFVDSGSLVVVISYSGNTLETLIAFKRAVELGLRVVAVSSGGVLEEDAKRFGVLHVKVPGGLLPRASLPAMLYAVLGLLDASGYTIVPRGEAESSAVFLANSRESALAVSERTANWLYSECAQRGRLITISTHSPLDALALRFKNELNENSKLYVKVDVAPEWMHNDVVGLEAPVVRDICVLELVDPGSATGVRLVEFMKGIYSELGAIVHRLDVRGESTLEKLMYGSLVAGLTSSRLGELRGLDPAATRTIQLYKSRVAEIFKA